jgi:hypothetical protein
MKCAVPGCDFALDLVPPNPADHPTLAEFQAVASQVAATGMQAWHDHYASHFMPDPVVGDDRPLLGALTDQDGHPAVRFAPGWVAAVHLSEAGFAQIVAAEGTDHGVVGRALIAAGRHVLNQHRPTLDDLLDAARRELGDVPPPSRLPAPPFTPEEWETLCAFEAAPHAEGTEDHDKKGPTL